MSGKKSIIKTMFIIILIGAFFLLMGGVSLVRAKTELDYYETLESGGLKVVGEIQHVETVTEKVLGSTGGTKWRTRYVADVWVVYEDYNYHGSVDVTPTMEQGELIEVYLNTETCEMIPVYSTTGNLLNFLSYVPGGFLTLIGVVIVLAAIISATSKLSVFKEKNKVYGVIVDVIENPNIKIDHKHPKKAICEIADPITGAVRRVESANSKMDLFGMVGMNVPIYVNPKRPNKVFVDLENAEGELNLREGQQRVHDFRNL